MNTSENDLVLSALKRVKKRAQACLEVPLLGRYVDLVYLEKNSVVSIEFKLHNWRKALEQSYDHKLGVDFAYICMPKRRVTQKMEIEIKTAGVGLKFFCDKGSWPFKIVIPAPKSSDVWPVARKRVREYIQENQEAR